MRSGREELQRLIEAVRHGNRTEVAEQQHVSVRIGVGPGSRDIHLKVAGRSRTLDVEDDQRGIVAAESQLPRVLPDVARSGNTTESDLVRSGSETVDDERDGLEDERCSRRSV